MISIRILVRGKVQGLNFHTHPDLNQNLSPLLRKFRRKIHDFEKTGNFNKFYFIFLHKNQPKIENKDKGKHAMLACVSDIDANACAWVSPRPQLLHAQGFKSKSLTVASQSLIESTTFSEIHAKINALTPFHL